MKKKTAISFVQLLGVLLMLGILAIMSISAVKHLEYKSADGSINSLAVKSGAFMKDTEVRADNTVEYAAKTNKYIGEILLQGENVNNDCLGAWSAQDAAGADLNYYYCTGTPVNALNAVEKPNNPCFDDAGRLVEDCKVEFFQNMLDEDNNGKLDRVPIAFIIEKQVGATWEPIEITEPQIFEEYQKVVVEIREQPAPAAP